MVDIDEGTPDPLLDEKAMLVAYLDEQRKAMFRKVSGDLSHEQLTRRLVASETTLLGLVKHLIDVEAGWFRIVMAGEDDVPRSYGPDDPDGDFRVGPDETRETLLAGYEAEISRSNAITQRYDLDDTSARATRIDPVEDPPKVPVTLRWILLHMIEETARHAGHADILREQLDGATGT